MEGNRLLNIVLPLPGGPIKIMLWPPAAAISIERFTDSCPFTSAKSNSGLFKSLLNSALVSIIVWESSALPSKNEIASVILSIPYTFKPSTIAASFALCNELVSYE
jgi:hypothetical protein